MKCIGQKTKIIKTKLITKNNSDLLRFTDLLSNETVDNFSDLAFLSVL